MGTGELKDKKGTWSLLLPRPVTPSLGSLDQEKVLTFMWKQQLNWGRPLSFLETVYGH